MNRRPARGLVPRARSEAGGQDGPARFSADAGTWAEPTARQTLLWSDPYRSVLMEICMSENNKNGINAQKRSATLQARFDQLLLDLVSESAMSARADEDARRQRTRALTADPAAEAFREAMRAEAAIRQEKMARLRALRLAREAARPDGTEETPA
jgi:hypothetical protein